CLEYSQEIGSIPTIQILGGEDVGQGEFPHMAALGYEKDDELLWQCGGTLISNKFVLTAAHCVVRTGVTLSKIRLGIIKLDDVTDSIQEFGVLNTTTHKQYNRKTKKNDIALIELDNEAAITDTVHPACLYQNEDDPNRLLVTGWGYTTSNGKSSNTLQKAELHAVALAECSEVYVSRMQEPIVATQICAVSDNGTKDTCQGDSGGPLQVLKVPITNIYSLVGITSYGMGCGGITPAIYTRVYSYLDWIEEIVWRQNRLS
ncbi:hypothetical protein ILUMI_08619, partial [Ignelater luminosus]